MEIACPEHTQVVRTLKKIGNYLQGAEESPSDRDLGD